MIHSTAIIDDSVVIGSEVEIGPYVVIKGNVKIGNKTKIFNSSSIYGKTDIGSENTFYPFCSIGSNPQDLKFENEVSFLNIGNKNIFREHCTVNRGTKGGGLLTSIGNNSLFMVGVHIAHDCILGDSIIMANQATLGGHVIVENNAVIGGISAIHQFCRIGELSMIGGMSAVENDVPPYLLAIGNRAKISGLNLVGLKRAGFSKISILELNKKIKEIYLSHSVSQAIKSIEFSENILIENLKNFMLIESSRGLCPYDKK